MSYRYACRSLVFAASVSPGQDLPSWDGVLRITVGTPLFPSLSLPLSDVIEFETSRRQVVRKAPFSAKRSYQCGGTRTATLRTSNR